MIQNVFSSQHRAEPKYKHYFPDTFIRCVALSHLSAQGIVIQLSTENMLPQLVIH